MKKFSFYVNKHKFFICLVALLVSMFMCSKFTSHLIKKEVEKRIDVIELFGIKYEYLEDYLKNNGYSIQLRYNGIYDNYDIIAAKNEEQIEIEYQDSFLIQYSFINTNLSITPVISDLTWGDSLFEVKLKTGINSFSTRFTSLPYPLGTLIHLSNDSIVIAADEKVRYSYELSFDESSKLYKISIGKYMY